MTTRRSALGAIIGSVAIGPEVVKAAIDEGVKAMTQMPMSALVDLAKQSGYSEFTIAKWHRHARGEFNDDEDVEYQRDYERELKALKSVSPIVRRMWARERRVADRRAHDMRHAIRRLFELKAGTLKKQRYSEIYED